MSVKKEGDLPTVVEATPKKQRSGVRPLNPEALAHEPKSVAHSAEPTAVTPPRLPATTPPKSPAVVSVPVRAVPAWGSAGAMTDAEFLLTRNIIGHMQPAALISVLQSLVDDFPQLAPIIRVRCESAMSMLMQQHAAAQGPFLPFPYATQPVTMSPASQWNETTPPSAQHRRTTGHRRSTKEDETETCAVHGTVRTMKHLHYNSVSSQYECIHGFHCLEGNGITPSLSPQSNSAPSSISTTAAKLSAAPPPPNPSKIDDDDDENMTVQRLESILNALRQQE